MRYDPDMLAGAESQDIECSEQLYDPSMSLEIPVKVVDKGRELTKGVVPLKTNLFWVNEFVSSSLAEIDTVVLTFVVLGLRLE